MLLKSPTPGGIMSHRGIEYPIDKDGFVEVPSEVAPELCEILKFEVVPESKPPAAKPKKAE